MNYADLIPEKHPAGLVSWMQTQGAFKRGTLGYKMIGKEEARAWEDCDDFGGNFTRKKTGKVALLWCSECMHYSTAEYIQAENCHGHGGRSGIYLKDDYQQTSGDFGDGDDMRCPCCGEDVILRSASALRHGRTEQYMVVVPTVEAGRMVLTQWCVSKSVGYAWQEWGFSAFAAFVLDEGKLYRLVHYRKMITGNYYNLGKWEQTKRFIDSIGAPMFYMAELPSLQGTELENAKLWEYAAAAYEAGVFFPVAYIRLYKKRPAVENLVTAGMGLLLGQALKEDCQVQAYGYYGTGMRAPRLAWMNWKEAKPQKILNLTKEQLRTIKKHEWTAEQLKFYAENKEAIPFPVAVEALAQMRAYEVRSMLESGANIAKATHYLEKQKEGWYMLRDYWNAAEMLGMDMTQDVIKWPPHLRAAHDRVTTAKRYGNSKDLQQRFAAMTAKCSGLAWQHAGICIRPAESVEELIQEGATLKHCVGGYGEKHAAGEIILFIRHARRPERSWYTLNVNIQKKTIIQNHGYRNEMLPGGKRLHIPEEVKEFVELWKAQVLDPWKPATEKEDTHRREKKKPAAA